MNKFKNIILLTTLMFSTTAMYAYDFIFINDAKHDIKVWLNKKELTVKKGELLSQHTLNLPKKLEYQRQQWKTWLWSKIELPNPELLDKKDFIIIRFAPKKGYRLWVTTKGQDIYEWKYIKNPMEEMWEYTLSPTLTTKNPKVGLNLLLTQVTKIYKDMDKVETSQNIKEILNAIKKFKDNKLLNSYLGGTIKFYDTEEKLKQKKKELK